MQSDSLYPLKLQSALHVKVWGGRRLAELMNKALPTTEPYGESWELHDTSVVVNGALRGTNLGELALHFGADLLGADNDPADGIPLLAKLIDADAWLSIQVHPNDAQARELEGEPRGKSEAWVILHAEPGARLVFGLQPATSRQEMTAAIAGNQLESLLVYADVSAGDVLYIPANTVHALGPGLLIYEIQQSSDTTYRLYDWGRLGLDGEPRQLHIDRGVQVANLETLPVVKRPSSDLLVDGPYFRSWRHQLDGGAIHLSSDGKFQCLTCIDGSIIIAAEGCDNLTVNTGETALIPVCVRDFTLRGQGVILRSCQR